ncbi:MAG: hypothetical protein ACQGVK_19100 [Myxococcota bacterium]
MTSTPLDSDEISPSSRSQLEQLLKSAPAEARPHLERLLAQPLRRPDELRALLDRYWEKLEEHRDEYEFLDIGTAWTLVSQCRRLLLWLEESPTSDRTRLVQAAVRYFIKSNDGESDLNSPIGFDDDAEVVELVARLLGQEELLTVTGEGEGA